MQKWVKSMGGSCKGNDYEWMLENCASTCDLCKEAEKAANNEPDARVRCETTAGDFTIEMHRDWAPLGYDRFMELVKADFFSDQIIYRKIPGFLVQYGVAADSGVQAQWSNKRFPDDPNRHIPFTKGTGGCDRQSTS
jgi:hypothetical protein